MEYGTISALKRSNGASIPEAQQFRNAQTVSQKGSQQGISAERGVSNVGIKYFPIVLKKGGYHMKSHSFQFKMLDLDVHC